MAAQGYITPAERDAADRRPARARPGPAAAPRLRRGQRRPLRLRLRAEVPDPEARPDPARARPRRATSSRPRWTPSCSAPATPPSWTPCRWRTVRGARPSPPSQPGTGHLLAMSVNRIFGYDLNDPRQESYNLNVAPSRGAGLDLQGVRRRRRAGPRLLDDVHADDAEPVLSRVYKEDGGPYTRRERRQLPGDAGPDDGALPVLQHLLRRAGGRPRQRRGAGAHGRGDGAVPVRPARAGADRSSTRTAGRSPRPGRDQPARPGQRLLHARRRRHPVRRRPGDGGPRPARRSRATDDDGAPLAIGRPLHARGDPAGSRTRSTRCCARTSSPATPARPASRAYVRGHQIAGKTGTTQDNVSVAFVGYTPEIAASVMVFNPKENETSAASAAARARPSGATRWRRS